MNSAYLLCAMAMCVSLVLEAGAAEPPVRGRSSPAVTKMQHPAGTSASGLVMSTRAGGRVQSQESVPIDSNKGFSSNERHAAAATPLRGLVTVQRGVSGLARSNSDRLRSLLHQQARGLGVKASSRSAQSSRAATTALVPRIRGSRDASAIVPIKKSIPNDADRVPQSIRVVARGSAIGGPHVAGTGRGGRAARGRTVNNLGLDGTQVHRKF
jgi:hypothetical protein